MITHDWRKSSYSQGENTCVEMKLVDAGRVGVRDSKLGDASPVLLVTGHQWRAFLESAGTTLRG